MIECRQLKGVKLKTRGRKLKKQCILARGSVEAKWSKIENDIPIRNERLAQ